MLVFMCMYMDQLHAMDTLSKWDYRSCSGAHAQNMQENKGQEEERKKSQV